MASCREARSAGLGCAGACGSGAAGGAAGQQPGKPPAGSENAGARPPMAQQGTLGTMAGI